MEKLIRYLFYFFLLSSSTVSVAQLNEINLQYHPVGIGGFEENWITALAQDQQGFIWMAGSEGLYKYNGYEYELFKNIDGDSTSLIENAIEA